MSYCEGQESLGKPTAYTPGTLYYIHTVLPEGPLLQYSSSSSVISHKNVNFNDQPPATSNTVQYSVQPLS